MFVLLTQGSSSVLTTHYFGVNFLSEEFRLRGCGETDGRRESETVFVTPESEDTLTK